MLQPQEKISPLRLRQVRIRQMLDMGVREVPPLHWGEPRRRSLAAMRRRRIVGSRRRRVMRGARMMGLGMLRMVTANR